MSDESGAVRLKRGMASILSELEGLFQRDELGAVSRELLDDCHAFETRFASTGAAPDPQGTFFYAGQQWAGWHLWTQLDDADPALASLMRREIHTKE